MCGIAGVFAYGASAPRIDLLEIDRISHAMRRRGPDDYGRWAEDAGRVAFAHRRLAIIDLAPTGHQPMTLDTGRLQITFNGEIYNYRDLRRELADRGCRFASQSDTEVLLNLYDRHGPDMLSRLRGMYAFAIWDAARQRLFVARDPLGIKPLYYADDGSSFRFASQARAMLGGGALDGALDPAAALGFLVWGAVPEPLTMWRNIRCLPAGQALLVDANGAKPFVHFDACAVLAATPLSWSNEQLRDDLIQSVRHHMVADVPVGVFLSGGVDSIALASQARAFAAGKLVTVNVGFDTYKGQPNDEAEMARRAADLLDAQFHYSHVTYDDFRRDRAAILGAMDQPTIDGINTYFVSRAAAQAGLKVALSGIGADELFGGYPSFHQIPRIVHTAGRIPGLRTLGRVLRGALAPMIAGVTSPKYASAIELSGTIGDAYLLRRGLFLPWELPGIVDRDVLEAATARAAPHFSLQQRVAGIDSDHAKIAALEISTYMRNQLLRDTDWASMAHSLEVRTPYVDAVLLAQLAPKISAAEAPRKRDLLALVDPVLRASLASKPKIGFQVPVREWMTREGDPAGKARGLRGWAVSVLRSFGCDFVHNPA